jgi:hypothetical protein
VTKFDVSSDAIRELARRPPILPSSFMRIIVVPQEYLYGMMRMFQILSDQARPELRVVRTMDEAYRLLLIESPEFSPVS